MQRDALKDLQVRLERIEKAIETQPKPQASSLSEDDVAAYHRVRSVLWEDGSCGINETSPCVISCRIIDKICRVVPVICRACDVECTCGPCNIFSEIGSLRGGISRFSRLGG
jgi:hypothetical protein